MTNLTANQISYWRKQIRNRTKSILLQQPLSLVNKAILLNTFNWCLMLLRIVKEIFPRRTISYFSGWSLYGLTCCYSKSPWVKQVRSFSHEASTRIWNFFPALLKQWFSCKQFGHITCNCNMKFCNYCKQHGHIKDCPTICTYKLVKALEGATTSVAQTSTPATSNIGT